MRPTKLIRAIPLALALLAPSAFASTCPYTYICVGDTTNAQLPNATPATQALGAQSVAFGGRALTNGSTAIGDGSYAGYNGGFDPATTMANAYATAIGYSSQAWGAETFAGGYLSSAKGTGDVALGSHATTDTQNTGSTKYSTAIGAYAQVDGYNATGIGSNVVVNGNGSFGAGASAQAIGLSNIAILGSATGSDHSIAIGGISSAPYANAWGFNAEATAQNADAIGASSRATEANTVSFGDASASYYRRLVNVADATSPQDVVTLNQVMQSTAALGGGASYAGGTFTAPSYSLGSQTFHDVGSALTYLNGQIGTGGGASTPVWLASTDTTTPATAQGTDGTSVGAGAQAGNGTTAFNVALGARAQAGTLGTAVAGTGGQDTAVGVDSAATAVGAEAFGYQAQATAAFSTSIGNGSLADQSGTVSFGNGTTGIYRRLVNVQDGTAPHDAMTVGQGQLVTSIFGGGASLLTDTAPTYTFTSPGAAGSYYDVGSALSALDNGLNAVNTRIDNLPPPGTGGGNGTDALAVHYDSTDKSSVTLEGKDGTTIHNVSAGVAPTDAANVSQVQTAKQEAIDAANSYADAGDTRTLNSAEHYADQGDAAVKDWAKAYTDDAAARTLRDANAYTDMRFKQLNDRFARVNAMGSAETSMSANFRGDNSLAAGVGFAGGHNALAVGYRHVMAGGHVSVSFHGAISGSERTLGAGIGYSW